MIYGLYVDLKGGGHGWGVLDRTGSEAYVIIMLRGFAIAWLASCLRRLRRRISQLSTVCNFATFLSAV
jgi:hypothetical protein